jgi:hypothetical protein
MLLMMRTSYIEAGCSVNPVFGSFSEIFDTASNFQKRMERHVLLSSRMKIFIDAYGMPFYYQERRSF